MLQRPGYPTHISALKQCAPAPTYYYVATLVTCNYKYIESMPQRNKRVQGILVYTIRNTFGYFVSLQCRRRPMYGPVVRCVYNGVHPRNRLMIYMFVYTWLVWDDVLLLKYSEGVFGFDGADGWYCWVAYRISSNKNCISFGYCFDCWAYCVMLK